MRKLESKKFELFYNNFCQNRKQSCSSDKIKRGLVKIDTYTFRHITQRQQNRDILLFSSARQQLENIVLTWITSRQQLYVQSGLYRLHNRNEVCDLQYAKIIKVEIQI